MRGSRFKGSIKGKEVESTFLSSGKDNEEIIKRLFIDSKPYSERLKRLLVLNVPDCLTDLTNTDYIKIIDSLSVKNLKEKKYIDFSPRFIQTEHEEVKSRIIIRYQQFNPTLQNKYFMDRILEIDVLSHVDYWDLNNYQIRPILIAGYINAILDNGKFSGLGTLQFNSSSYLQVSRDYAGYCMIYTSVHGVDDTIES